MRRLASFCELRSSNLFLQPSAQTGDCSHILRFSMADSIKRVNRFLAYQWVAILLLSFHSHAEQGNPVVRLQTLQQVSSGWKTLLNVENNLLSGRFRDLIDCSFEQIPFQVSYGFAPFSRIQRQVQSQQADGYFPANLTIERLAYATPSIPLIDDYKVLIRNKAISPSRELRIAAMRGATQELNIAKRFSDLVYPITNYDHLVSMLDAGRIDAVVGSHLFFSVTEGFDKIDQRFVITRLESSSMRAFFGNEFLRINPTFLVQFNRALNTCLQSAASANHLPASGGQK